MNRKSLIIIFIGAVVALAGCSTAGCYDNQSAIPLAQFKASETGSAISLSILDIYGLESPNDSLILQSGTSASQVYLPVRSTGEQTSWVLHYQQVGIDDDAYNDTITFKYNSIPYFASEECGAMYYYFIKEMYNTCHLIDSVVVTDSLITNVDVARIDIYFRTSTEESDQ